MFNLDGERPVRINYLILIIVSLEVIFIIVSVTTIIAKFGQSDQISSNDYSGQPHISIEDFSRKITNFPVGKQDYLQNGLLNIAQINNPDINLGDVKARIRDDSVYEHYFALPDLNYSSAIVDIPELNQSYQVFLQSSQDEYNRNLDPNGSIIFLCIEDPSDIIYKDFDCIDIYSQKTRNSIVEKYLKYFQFDGFISWLDNYENVVIAPIDFGIVDEEGFIIQAKEAIRSLGISPDLFNYNIMQGEEYNFVINR